jgi:hypothetical protein
MISTQQQILNPAPSMDGSSAEDFIPTKENLKSLELLLIENKYKEVEAFLDSIGFIDISNPLGDESDDSDNMCDISIKNIMEFHKLHLNYGVIYKSPKFKQFVIICVTYRYITLLTLLQDRIDAYEYRTEFLSIAISTAVKSDNIDIIYGFTRDDEYYGVDDEDDICEDYIIDIDYIKCIAQDMLVQAVESGNIKNVEKIIEFNRNSKYGTDEHSYIHIYDAILVAIKLGYIDMIEPIKDYHTFLSDEGLEKYIKLIYAVEHVAKSGNIKNIKTTIENIDNDDSGTAYQSIVIAIKLGYTDIVKLIKDLNPYMKHMEYHLDGIKKII